MSDGLDKPLDLFVKKIVLERWHYATQWKIHPELIQAEGLLRAYDCDAYLARLSAYVWGIPDGEDRHEFPTTWWDAFKQRWFPRWALKRWPVNITTVTARRGVIYPEFSPGSGRGVRADRLEVIRWKGGYFDE